MHRRPPLGALAPLLLLLVAPAARAQKADAPSPRGRVWVEGGHQSFTSGYDDEGEEEDITGDGSFAVTTFGAGGEYTLRTLGDLGIGVGAGLWLSNNTFEVGSVDRSSGFAPENVGVWGRVGTPAYSFYGGVLVDVGAEAEEDLAFEKTAAPQAAEIPNSDGAHAVMVGAAFEVPRGPARFFGGADYFLTLQESEDFGGAEITTDPGDHAGLHLGGAFRAGAAELGVSLLYSLVTAATLEFDGNAAAEGDDGYNLSVSPFVRVAPAGSPLRLTARLGTTGGVFNEYTPLGFSLAGKNTPVGRLGGTVSLSYALR